MPGKGLRTRRYSTGVGLATAPVVDSASPAGFPHKAVLVKNECDALEEDEELEREALGTDSLVSTLVSGFRQYLAALPEELARLVQGPVRSPLLRC